MFRQIVKNGIEIGTLAGELSPRNQAYVLNTINTLLYSQQEQQEEPQSVGKLVEA